MATTGSFDFNLTAVSTTTNNSIGLVEAITEEMANQGDLMGLAIAIAIALTLIFGTIFIAINFIPRLLAKVKGLRGIR